MSNWRFCKEKKEIFERILELAKAASIANPINVEKLVAHLEFEYGLSEKTARRYIDILVSVGKLKRIDAEHLTIV